MAVKIVQENTAISGFMLPKEREISLAHSQRCSSLIMEHSSGPLSVENSRKALRFQDYLSKRESSVWRMRRGAAS
jgi:hypothetical protein